MTEQPLDALALLEGVTPGEWLVQDGAIYGDSDHTREGSYAFGVPILRIDNSYRRWGRDVSHDEHAANARLIAAAPRLARENIAKDETIAERDATIIALTEQVEALREALAAARNTMAEVGMSRAVNICDAALASTSKEPTDA